MERLNTNKAQWGLTNRLSRSLGNSPLAKRLLSGSLWSVAGGGVNRVLALASSLVVARVLGTAGYGEYGIIQGAISSFTLFGGFGLGLTANKYLAEFRTSDPARAGRILALSRATALVMGGFVALLVFVSADYIAGAILGPPHLAAGLRVASLVLLFGSINEAQIGALSGLEAFRGKAIVTLFTGLGSVICVVFGTLAYGLLGALWGAAISSGLSCLIARQVLAKQLKAANIDSPMFADFSEFQVLWRFSFPSVLAALSVAPVNWACNLILVNQSNGYAQMGVLNAAIQWRAVILFVPGLICSVSLPMLANLWSIGDRDKAKKILLATSGVAGVLAFSCACLVAFFAVPIMKRYGEGFEAGSLVLILQVTAGVFAAVLGVLGQFLMSVGRLWLLIYLQLVWALVNIVLTWFMRTKGAEGLSIAYLGAYLVHLSLTLCVVARILRRDSHRPEAGV